jgi:hypothetical protein
MAAVTEASSHIKRQSTGKLKLPLFLAVKRKQNSFEGF